MTSRFPPILSALLIATPLAALSAWVVHGALTRDHGPTPEDSNTGRPQQPRTLPFRGFRHPQPTSPKPGSRNG